jgi:hypothetical protein
MAQAIAKGVPAEMNEKRDLYFEAGAQEVWLCGLDGKMEFYTPDLSAASRLYLETAPVAFCSDLL